MVSRRIEELFSLFATHYDNLWMSKFKSKQMLVVTKCEWDKTLACFSDEIISLSIKRFCKKSEYPPNLVQMTMECQSQANRLSVYEPEKREACSKEVALSNLNQMYAYLCVKKKHLS